MARTLVPHYGDGKTPLSEIDIFLLADRAGVSVSREEMGCAWIVTPRLSGGRDLHLRTDLPDAACGFLVLVEVARAKLGGDPHARRDAEVFAAVGVYPCVKGSADDLRAIDATWYATHWPDVWARASRIAGGDDERAEVPAAEVYGFGRDAREKGNHSLAAACFADAARLGEVECDWTTVARSWTALGNIELRNGEFSAARLLFSRALEVVGEHRLHEQHPLTLHDSFRLEAHDGRDHAAVRLAAKALAAYDRDAPQFVRFVHDVAWFLVDRGLYLRAIPLLREVDAVADDADLRVAVLGNLAVSHAGAGDGAGFRDAERRLDALLLSMDGHEHAPRAYLSIAEGALMLGEWSKAEAAAACAVTEASLVRQRAFEVKARRVLDAARAGRRLPRLATRLPEDLVEAWDGLARAVSEATPSARAAGGV